MQHARIAESMAGEAWERGVAVKVE